MSRAISIGQLVYATLLCALLAAKIPSFVDANATAFSLEGAVVGAVVALVAFGIGSLASPLAETAELKGGRAQLALMRGAVACSAVAMTSFTALLYLHYGWIKLLLAAAIVSGVVCVVGASFAAWSGRRTDA